MKLIKKQPQGECWETHISWSSTYAYFLSQEEAVAYANQRLEALLAHPTAGPKVNGKKPRREDLQVKEYSLGRNTVFSAGVGVDNWFFGGAFTVTVKHLRD